MELKLRVLDGKHAGQDIPVLAPRFFIGRAEDCQLRPGSDMISRHHCVLLIDEGYVGVRDLGSKNGTYVNEERLTSERELHHGDQLKVGPLEFEVLLSTSTGLGGKKRPAVTGGVKEAATRAATTAAEAGDIDITQWLAPEPAQPAPHDTGLVFASDDTTEINVGQAKELALSVGLLPTSDPPAQEADSSAGPKTDPKAKKPPGKLPFQPQRIMAKDSRDAAARVLDMMKKRR